MKQSAKKGSGIRADVPLFKVFQASIKPRIYDISPSRTISLVLKPHWPAENPSRVIFYFYQICKLLLPQLSEILLCNDFSSVYSSSSTSFSSPPGCRLRFPFLHLPEAIAFFLVWGGKRFRNTKGMIIHSPRIIVMFHSCPSVPELYQ